MGDSAEGSAKALPLWGERVEVLPFRQRGKAHCARWSIVATWLGAATVALGWCASGTPAISSASLGLVFFSSGFHNFCLFTRKFITHA